MKKGARGWFSNSVYLGQVSMDGLLCVDKSLVASYLVIPFETPSRSKLRVNESIGSSWAAVPGILLMLR